MAISPQRLIGTHDEAAKQLLRRLLLEEQARQQGPSRVPQVSISAPGQPTGPIEPSPAPSSAGPVRIPQDAATRPRTTGVSTGLIDPGNLNPYDRPVLKNEDGSISTTSSMGVGTDRGETIIPTVVDGVRLTPEEAMAQYKKSGGNFGSYKTVEQGDTAATALHNDQAAYLAKNGIGVESTMTRPRRLLEPGAATPTEYANRGVAGLEKAAAQMPQGNYSQATLRPELGIDALNRTGKVRPASEKPAEVMSGVTYHDKAADIPPIRIPTLSDAAVSDSTVQMPMPTGTIGPQRMKDPAAQDIPRLADESDTAYAARKHRSYREALRTESPDSKITETPGGVTVAPPMKRRGLGGRSMAGLLLALANMRGATPAAAAGSALANFLTGAIAPDLERKVERDYQIQKADTQSKVLDEQEQRDLAGAERRARTQQIADYPRRQEDDEKDKRWGRREQQMRLLAASPAGFDPQHNPEHKKLALDALADGQILPAIPPKAARATNQTPHTSTRSVTAGEFPGLKAGTKIRQIWNGTEFEDDLQNGKPVITGEPTEKPQTPDIRGDLRGQLGSLDSEIATSQAEWNRHNSYVQQKQRAWQAEAAKRKAAAQVSDPTGQTLEAKRSLKEWADILRNEDPEYVAGGFDTSTTSRDWLAQDLTEKKAMAKQLRTQLEQEERRPRQAAYSGDTFTAAQVQAWAKARGVTVAKARRMLEKEGATIQ